LGLVTLGDEEGEVNQGPALAPELGTFPEHLDHAGVTTWTRCWRVASLTDAGWLSILAIPIA
jgi:hypothetical protein